MHNARPSAEEPVAEESLPAHARRLLRSRVSSAATAVLDAGIALLQRLRKAAGGTQDAQADDGRPGARNGRPGGRHDDSALPVETEAEAPKPKRRVRALLVYLCLLLAGGMGGGALAYNLLENLLNRQMAENRRIEAATAKQVKSAATTQKKLEEEQTLRIEAEKNLKESLADYAKSAAEKQKKLDEAEKQLATMLAAGRTRNVPQLSPAGSGRAGGKAHPPKAGNCTLNSNNIAALKDCIDDFNR